MSKYEGEFIQYNKLIRDKIPEYIIDKYKNKKRCYTKILDQDEYRYFLNLKLQEEINEYLESEDNEELADILEVIYAIAKIKGIGVQDVEQIREEKHLRLGGFDKKLLLLHTIKK